jgi:carboxylesterase
MIRRSPDAGRSASVLLLHGLTGTPSEMRPVARHLSKLGYTVETPLLAGHGRTHRELLRTTWRDWVDGARRSLRQIAAQSAPVVVAGLSMGALLAVLLAAEEETASSVVGIVLLSTTMRYDGSSIPATRVFLPLAHLFPFLGKYFYWTESPPYGLRDERLQHLITRAIENAERGETAEYGLFRTYVGALRQLSLMVREVRRRAARVRCPALVVHSLEDTVTSAENAREIYRRLGSRDKSLQWLSGCDHVITVDLCKRDVARLVGDFVARVAPFAEAPRRREIAG